MSDTPRSTSIGDAALAHLRAVIDEPDLAGTRYELLEPVGRGGMGVVWRARDRQLDREVALKVLATPDEESARLLASWLEREAKVLARLEHPGIVPVHDVGLLPDGRVYYAMKLVRGKRLDELVRAGLPVPERLRIFARVCEAVAFAHSRGVLHRDLKPANVMVGEFGEVLVLDWGLAHVPAADGREADRGLRVGTPGFMAPEQESGSAVDVRADVFSLGKLLQSLEVPGKPAAAIVRKATAPRREERYAAVVALDADVAAFQRGGPVSALPESVIVKLERLYRSCRVGIWIVAAYIVLRLAVELDAALVVGATGMSAAAPLAKKAAAAAGKGDDAASAIGGRTMKTVLIGLALGAILGAIDGACSWFYPEVREVPGKVVFISFASAGKGLVAGLITGFIARKLRSLPLGMVVGFLVFALITLPVALGEDPVTHKVYFWEIMIPGAICGMFVGYATQRYGIGSKPRVQTTGQGAAG